MHLCKTLSESFLFPLDLSYGFSFVSQDPIGPDSGTYRCNVKNEYGESNANLNLNIEAEAEPEGDPPTFIEKPKIRSEQGGKLVVMECKVKAKPMPEILWFHEGKELQQSDRISWTVTLKGDKYHIRLEVKDPRKEDTGLYKCNIKNFHGELNANLTLNIESKSFFIGINIHLKKVLAYYPPFAGL